MAACGSSALLFLHVLNNKTWGKVCIQLGKSNWLWEKKNADVGLTPKLLQREKCQKLHALDLGDGCAGGPLGLSQNPGVGWVGSLGGRTNAGSAPETGVKEREQEQPLNVLQVMKSWNALGWKGF